MKETIIEKGYFRDHPRFGRTTKLVEKATGRVLLEAMGVCTRKQLWNSYVIQSEGERR